MRREGSASAEQYEDGLSEHRTYRTLQETVSTLALACWAARAGHGQMVASRLSALIASEASSEATAEQGVSAHIMH